MKVPIGWWRYLDCALHLLVIFSLGVKILLGDYLTRNSGLNASQKEPRLRCNPNHSVWITIFPRYRLHRMLCGGRFEALSILISLTPARSRFHQSSMTDNGCDVEHTERRPLDGKNNVRNKIMTTRVQIKLIITIQPYPFMQTPRI
jgi:hypothetical protein